MSAPRILGCYRFTFSALILLASLQTLVAAHADHAIALLATTEIAGALILCWRRTQWLGAALLLGVFRSCRPCRVNGQLASCCTPRVRSSS